MAPACIAAFQTAFFGFTGSFETFRCQTLSAGNTSHAVPATGTAYAGSAGSSGSAGARTAAPKATTLSRTVSFVRMTSSSASAAATVEPLWRRTSAAGAACSSARRPRWCGPRRRPHPRAGLPDRGRRPEPGHGRRRPAGPAYRLVAGDPVPELPGGVDAVADPRRPDPRRRIRHRRSRSGSPCSRSSPTSRRHGPSPGDGGAGRRSCTCCSGCRCCRSSTCGSTWYRSRSPSGRRRGSGIGARPSAGPRWASP